MTDSRPQRYRRALRFATNTINMEFGRLVRDKRTKREHLVYSQPRKVRRALARELARATKVPVGKPPKGGNSTETKGGLAGVE